MRKEGKFDVEKFDREFFDYIFCEFFSEEKERKLSEKMGILVEIIYEMKEEFEYWYLFDWCCLVKDLILNYLMFFIFNYVVIFDKKYWFKGIVVNGFGMLEG